MGEGEGEEGRLVGEGRTSGGCASRRWGLGVVVVVVGGEAAVGRRRQRRRRRGRRRVAAIGWGAMRRGETARLCCACKLLCVHWAFAATLTMMVLDGRASLSG